MKEIMKIHDELLELVLVSDMETPQKSFSRDTRIADKSDMVIYLLKDIAKKVATDVGLNPRAVMDILLDEVIDVQGSKSLGVIIKARWEDTKKWINIYENKKLSSIERLKAKPILKARRFL